MFILEIIPDVVFLQTVLAQTLFGAAVSQKERRQLTRHTDI